MHYPSKNSKKNNKDKNLIKNKNPNAPPNTINKPFTNPNFLCRNPNPNPLQSLQIFLTLQEKNENKRKKNFLGKGTIAPAGGVHTKGSEQI
jgi:hypothetical protein